MEHADGAEGARLARHVDPPAAQRPGDAGAVHGSGAAGGDDGEAARIVAALDAQALHRVQQVLLQQADDAGGGGLDVEAQRLGHTGLDGGDSAPLVKTYRAAGIGSRTQAPEHQLGVGHGRRLAAEAITRRTGAGAGPLGSDEQHAARVDPGDGAAAGAQRMDLDRGHGQVIATDDESVGDVDGAAAHQGDVAAGAADVHGDEVVAAGGAAEQVHGADPRRRPRQHQVDRRIGDIVDRHHAAVALHQQHRPLEALPLQALVEGAQVGDHLGRQVGVDDSRRGPFVLAHDGDDVGRHRYPIAVPGAADGLGRGDFVGGLHEAVDQAYGDRVDAALAEGLDGPPRRPRPTGAALHCRRRRCAQPHRSSGGAAPAPGGRAGGGPTGRGGSRGGSRGCRGSLRWREGRRWRPSPREGCWWQRWSRGRTGRSPRAGHPR